MCAGSTKIAAPIVILKIAAASPRMPMTRRRAGSVVAGTREVMKPKVQKSRSLRRRSGQALRYASPLPFSYSQERACHPERRRREGKQVLRYARVPRATLRMTTLRACLQKGVRRKKEPILVQIFAGMLTTFDQE